ncbi:hypothetical protein METHB2_360005 [Candidatus Methylobacter favarea]|uniref:Uncharacterized protein n=1 Tax=Candidatus Methylobacter favarea TaxID=2707345 RepID=A0A8S0WJ97_9GAMM|nr:hypothetical protein [Candidatus Methylobacter favarea]CAA9891164.1 hypothetical protein METHB2_360005 [Candidatus Methylobacter favarea]
MTQQNLITSRRTVALAEDTIVRLKAFSKANRLKMYEVMDTLVNLAYQDEGIKKRIIDETRRLSQEKKSIKVTLAQKANRLDPKLRERLRTMSAEELGRLLERG